MLKLYQVNIYRFQPWLGILDIEEGGSLLETGVDGRTVKCGTRQLDNVGGVCNGHT